MIWGLLLTSIVSTCLFYDLALCELAEDYPHDAPWHNALTAALLACIPWCLGGVMWFLVEVLA